MPRSMPPLGENARRLLAVVDRMPVRVPERDRVVTALEMVATEEWLRVRIALVDEQVRALSRPALSFTPDDLAHVLEVAATVAYVYGFESVGTGHVAVALAATSRGAAGAIDIMAEAFGLGTLENSTDIVAQHLALKETARTESREEPGEERTGAGQAGGERADEEREGQRAREEEPGEEEVIYGESLTGRRWHRAATIAHLGLRAAAFCVLLVIAARGGDAWMWPVAFAALISTRDSREPGLPLGDEVSPLQPSARWPWLGCLAVVAGALGMRAAAAVIVVEFLLLEAVSCVGVRMVSRWIWIQGGAVIRVGRHVSGLLSVVDAYATRRRCRHLAAVVFLAVVPAAAVAVAMSPLWPLYLMAGVFAARRWTVLALVTSVVATVSPAGSAWSLLSAWAGGLLARAVIAWYDRPPSAIVPVPAPRPTAVLRRLGRAYARAHRLVRIGRPAAALRWLDGARDAADPRLVTLRAWALLQCGRPGEAKSVIGGASDADDRIRAMITCLAELELSNADAADRALTEFGGVDEDMPEILYQVALVARIRLTLLNAGSDQLTEAIASGVPRRIRRAELLFAVTLLRLAAESALPAAPALSSLLAGAGALLSAPELHRAPQAFFDPLDRRRPLALENTRCLAQGALAELYENGSDTETVARLHAGEGITGYLMRMDRPVEAAGILNALADRLSGEPGYRLAVVLSRIEALAMLNATRHQLSEAEDRRRWWRVYGHTIEQAMRDAAAGSDWETLLELIESARLQLGPHKDSSAFDASRAVAPFIQVRGASRMEQAHWYRPGERPPAYALEDIAGVVLGPDTWWWSTWSTGTELFWALMPPDAPVSGGVLPMGHGSELHGALSDLRDALPVPHPGEDTNAFEDRVLRSPLLAGPAAAETALARRLGRLLPAPLVDALLRTREPLPLAFAPAAELANVPWACVGIPTEAPGDLRLVERCVPVIAPPAGLLATIAARPRNAGAAPLALAVIDPGGDLGGAAAEEPLSTARRLLDVLPPAVEIISPDDDVSVADFAARLSALGDTTSAVFACHTEDDGDSPSSCGLVLRPRILGGRPCAARPRLLTADLLIGDPGRFAMPKQVLLLACETADLRNAVAGEWLVLGPAMLWAGADRAIVTSFPVIDTAEGHDRGDVIDRHLVRLLVERRPLAAGLRAVQLEQLARWRDTRHHGHDTGPPGAPVHWGGHLAMGAFADPRPLPAPRPARRQLVHRSVPGLLDDAARRAAQAGRSVIASRDLLLWLALHGFEEDLPPWRRMLIHAVAYPFAVVPAVFRRRPGSAALTRAAPGPQVQELLRSAYDAARLARHRVIDVEHLLVAVLGARGPAGRIARALCGWDARQPEVIKAILGDTQHGYQHTGLPALRYLDPAAIADVYAALEAPVPDDEDDELRLLSDR
ncbi:CHAT domain-containing protein [Actinoallomurus purpureus]|uniref:CHAT domain-containing protein n=1 Tax=Actinoallomurus purpureus TaxID=478114 RepID=UPI0020937A8A|nr:CHAT domain-containing protein [Actinoallomurus purpureus]MCO6004175.1 CHAT domain-containing protein [Actinoallomurus purpureus]